MQQPDIEIYVNGASSEDLKAWLESQFPNLEVIANSPKRQVYNANWQDQGFNITVLSKVHHGFTSILFDSSSLPWDCDQACAQQAYTALQKPVRCIKSSWQEGDEPDQWLHIDQDGEQLVSWH